MTELIWDGKYDANGCCSMIGGTAGREVLSEIPNHITSYDPSRESGVCGEHAAKPRSWQLDHAKTERGNHAL